MGFSNSCVIWLVAKWIGFSTNAWRGTIRKSVSASGGIVSSGRENGTRGKDFGAPVLSSRYPPSESPIRGNPLCLVLSSGDTSTKHCRNCARCTKLDTFTKYSRLVGFFQRSIHANPDAMKNETVATGKLLESPSQENRPEPARPRKAAR